MTSQEIADGNKLIGIFMGEEVTPDGKWQSKHNGIMDFRYDSSWDWLMPVVEKIEKIKGVTIIIRRAHCEILSFGKTICLWASDSKMEACYSSVVDFINWHNSQGK